MKVLSIITIMIFLLSIPVVASAKTFGKKYCNQPGYECIKIKRGDTWKSLFVYDNAIDLVKRLNRMNINLYPGLTLAVPKNLHRTTLRDITPFPNYADVDENTVIVDQSELAWGAYSSSGKLLNWGPISGGKNYCADVGSKCTTVKGEFTFTRKKNASCVSGKYPIGKGGAPMPYCMFFHRGYAMHGSPVVPGYNASHGCVRLFNEDAEWLNTEFVQIGKTKIIIRQ